MILSIFYSSVLSLLATPGRRKKMSITVHCPKGHRLIANENHAGKTGRCPVCRAVVSIPMPSSGYLSESAILSILGETSPMKKRMTDELSELAEMAGLTATAHHSTVAENRTKTKLCPSCDREIDTGYHICPHCQTYISSLGDF